MPDMLLSMYGSIVKVSSISPPSMLAHLQTHLMVGLLVADSVIAQSAIYIKSLTVFNWPCWVGLGNFSLEDSDISPHRKWQLARGPTIQGLLHTLQG